MQYNQTTSPSCLNEAQSSGLSLIDNEGEMSNCLYINQLVGRNVILKKQTETTAKREFSAIVWNLKIDTFRYYSSLSQVHGE